MSTPNILILLAKGSFHLLKELQLPNIVPSAGEDGSETQCCGRYFRFKVSSLDILGQSFECQVENLYAQRALKGTKFENCCPGPFPWERSYLYHSKSFSLQHREA